MAENQRAPARKDYELAAKVFGKTVGWFCDLPVLGADGDLPAYSQNVVAWLPSQDNADAFRLLCAVKRWIIKNPSSWDSKSHAMKLVFDNLHAAFSSGDERRVREAIFWLAVEIGRAMP